MEINPEEVNPNFTDKEKGIFHFSKN